MGAAPPERGSVPRVALLALGGIGGSSSAAAELALALAAAGGEPVLFGSRAVPRLSALPGERAAPSPAPQWVEAPPDGALHEALVREHRARPFDVVHVHFAGPHLFVAGDFARRFHLPLAVTLHGSDVTRDAGRGALGEALRNCAAVAVPSLALHEQCFHLSIFAQVVPNFIDCDRWSPGTSVRRRNSETRRPRLLFAGHLESWKGPDVLLEALKLLPGPGPRLHTFGDGSLGPRLAAAADRRVRFFGARPLGPATLHRADLLVVPSLRESFGMVALEGLAAGCPLVASGVGGLVDLVGPAGRLVAPGDPEALAQAIRQALLDPDHTQALADLGRARARERYDRLPGLARHLAFYASLV